LYYVRTASSGRSAAMMSWTPWDPGRRHLKTRQHPPETLPAPSSEHSDHRGSPAWAAALTACYPPVGRPQFRWGAATDLRASARAPRRSSLEPRSGTPHPAAELFSCHAQASDYRSLGCRPNSQWGRYALEAIPPSAAGPRKPNSPRGESRRGRASERLDASLR